MVLGDRGLPRFGGGRRRQYRIPESDLRRTESARTVDAAPDVDYAIDALDDTLRALKPGIERERKELLL